MEQELINILIDVHNKLLQISVKGDDVIRMGEVLIELRNTFNSINNQPKQESIQLGGDNSNGNSNSVHD